MSVDTAGTYRRLKYVASINDETLGEDTPAEFELQYVDIGDVDSCHGITGTTEYRFADAPSRARRRVRHGDVIISTVRTYLQAIAPIEEPPSNLIASTGFAVISPRSNLLDQRFCKYALREPQFLAEVGKRSFGVSYPAINASEIGDISIGLPPLAQQRSVADYLDAETVRLDTLIGTKERLLRLLAEKRRVLIARAITRGLNTDAPLRASGRWFGSIPEHWCTQRARWLFRERDERSDDGEEELLTVSHITGVTPRSEKDVTMFEATTTEGYKICEAGDLVINTLWAWMGAMGTSPVRGIVSPAYNVYVPGPHLKPSYIDALVRLSAFAQEVTRFSKGVWSSRLRLYPEGFFQVELPVPPLEEQRAIVRHIATETAKLDAMAAATETTIALLNERRAAVIAAAVNGQIDVSTGDAAGISAHH